MPVRRPKNLRPGRRAEKSKSIAKHGEGTYWQFRFDKTEDTEVLIELFRCRSKEEIEDTFGIKIDEDLKWGNSMRDIVKNLLITIARRKRVGAQAAAPTKKKRGGSRAQTYSL